MKNKIIQLLLVTFCLISSNIFADNGTVVKYISGANDMALITMELKSSGKFVIHFKPIDGNKKHQLKGKWEVKNNQYQLTFKGWRKPDVEALFKQNNSPKKVKILNKRQVNITKNQSAIWIWGIHCQKQ